jgi:TRAP-type C4-dicarboxylate transport system substrate-binding protein
MNYHCRLLNLEETMKNLKNVALAGALALSAACVSAQEITLKVHHFLSAQSPAHARLLTPWCDKVSKESGGRLKCQIFPSLQLGGTPPQLYDQAKDGVADIVWTLPGYNAGRFPTVEAFELPFMMSNAEGTSRALWHYVDQQAKAEFKDVRPLAFHVHGPGYIHMREKPIRSLADMKGVKVRAPTRLTNKLIAAMGATPVGMPVPQVPEALSRGVIDGAVIPWEVVPAVRVHELTKHHTETDSKLPALYTSVFIVAMNPAKYDSLPADLKKVIDANSGADFSAQAGRIIWDADATGRKLAQERGNQFHMLGAAEIDQWRKLSQSVTDEWVKEMNGKGRDGAALLKAAQGLIAQHSK